MKEVVVLLFTAWFSNGDVQSHSEVLSLSMCEAKVKSAYSQPIEVYAKNAVLAVYATCVEVFPKKIEYE